MLKVTAIIPTFNEAHNIAAAIHSVQWASEIIVIDSFSTDKTVEIAKSLGAKVVQHEYENSAAQKNRAIPMAQNEWVFILDADERVTPTLEQEIKELLKKEPLHQAYWIFRSNDFMGKRIHFSGWQGDKVIRLFKKDLCVYENKRVHAEVVCQGSVGFLKQKLLHNTYLGIDHYIQKLNRYAQWQAEDCLQKGKRINLFVFIAKPTFRFVKHYFIQQGFRDGIPGFVISVLQSYAVFMRYVKLWLLKKGRN
jgi:glycosyltransferase involved in cell wall biosynthesis